MIRCDKCKADMVEKKDLDEEFDKYRDEFIERLEMSRTEELWLTQARKREIHKCVKKESVVRKLSPKRSSSR